MSDLSPTREALGRSQAQLPVSSYFDEAVYCREQELLIEPGPRYLGHTLALPEVGDYLALRQEGDGRALIHTAEGIELVSNVCRHRQAVMLRGRGRTGTNVVCPLHRWTYDLHGQLVGAPHFPSDPCLHLKNYPVQPWNGLLFEGGPGRADIAAELASLTLPTELDFSGYVYDRAHIHVCDYNWKSFIEVYLEDYHVGPFHPGLGNFVATDDLRWQMGAEFSVQTVGVAKHGGEALGKPGSGVYRRWHDALLAYRATHHDNRPPKHGAIWLTLHPTVMLEWYPHVLVVSTLYPQGPRKTLNLVEFFYPEEIAAFEREFVEAQQAAYMETCVEDDEIALRMDAGREALWKRGDCESGPYQSPMEDGMQHFHEWYRRRMAGMAEAAGQPMPVEPR